MAKHSTTQKTDDADKKLADALDKDSADVSTAAPASGSVYVFANLQNGQSFKLPASTDNPDGITVTIQGMPVSKLKGLDGQSFTGGKYGVTTIPAGQWNEVIRIYGKMKMFTNGLVFAAPSLERGKAMARERSGLRHGYEPVDPESNRTKSTPKTEE